MLEDSLFESRGCKRTRKPFTLVIAAIAHVVTIGVLVLIPLFEIQALPLPPVNMPLWLPKLELRSIQVFSNRSQTPGPSRPEQQAMTSFSAPQAIPDKIAITDEPPGAPLAFLPFSGNGNGINPFLSASEPTISGPGLVPPVPPPSAPLPPVPAMKATPIRTGGQVQAANLIHQVKPVYPTLAKQAHIQGVVVMEAVIGRGGAVESLRIVSGHPLLTQPAIDAVKQWKYRPTMLNGDPVDVITTITVTFTLQ